ncbi:hypothetical protein AAES_187181 [Amazona aestiva]|uniref:Neurobeachin n=1 Tax=Amazona aestiva TaxID=12930 RepID=A0A0Q3SP10_AMAAE|nr:hypothetical protein AAES_187181 [Amazona aestiva]
MASEKPVSGPDPQPAGLISVGASGGGGGGGGSSVAVMGELRASASGSVVLPAGMINPSVPIRNIRMKFAVLIGLIQVGEVSNRDIVETVLNLFRGDVVFSIASFAILRVYYVNLEINFKGKPIRVAPTGQD